MWGIEITHDYTKNFEERWMLKHNAFEIFLMKDHSVNLNCQKIELMWFETNYWRVIVIFLDKLSEKSSNLYLTTMHLKKYDYFQWRTKLDDFKKRNAIFSLP